jgi:hypothetical protein
VRLGPAVQPDQPTKPRRLLGRVGGRPRVEPGRTAARATSVAIVLAVAMWSAGVLLPVLAPLAPLPGALRPGVTFAADEIDVTTATSYVLQPDHARVQVVVDLTAVNRKPDHLAGGALTRFFYDGVNIGVQPEAANIHATQDGTSLKVRTAGRSGYRLVTALFTHNIYYQETARVRLTFDLPGGAPRSPSGVRVGTAFATFLAWAFGDRGTVRIEAPARFQVEVTGEDMQRAAAPAGSQALTATTTAPLDWYAWVNATDDAALARESLSLASGQQVVIQGWPEDPRWRSRVRTLLGDGLPDLAARIGLAWPVAGTLTVSEVHTPLLEGYGGFYDPATDAITISEDLDDLTIVHEASHAWFNSHLFTERWITEGLADTYAARVLGDLHRVVPKPGKVTRTAKAAFPLETWPPPAAIKDGAADARELYGYDASWTVISRIATLVGDAGMRRVLAAAAAGTSAYAGDGPPVATRLPNDWRRLVDLAEQVGGARGVADLVATWALGDADRRLLPARTLARAAYGDLVRAGGRWAAPTVVRADMDNWDFAAADAVIGEASTVLATRDRIDGLASAQGLVPAAGLAATYGAAATEAELVGVETQAAASLDTLQDVAAAAEAVAAPRDWLTGLGLDGADPGAILATARAAWERGDMVAARTSADDARGRLAAAPSDGRTRATVIGGGVALLLVGLGLAVVVRRRRGRVIAAASPQIAAGLTDARGPYDTLRPEGLPAEQPGPPPSVDEGADRS